MSRPLRGLLLGSIAIAFAYLIVHAREPMRLDLGDPATDANVLSAVAGSHPDGVATLFYSSLGKLLGIRDIGPLRLFALAWSGIATWLLYSYVRRLYSDRVALIATALFGTSLMWMMYADSLGHVPIMTAMMFLALWGLVRAIETKHPGHYVAALLGAFGACVTSSECYLFLSAGVLVTIYLKAGNPFAHGRRHFVAICAAGCMLGVAVKCVALIGTTSWTEFVAARRVGGAPVIPTLARRFTLVFTPFVWVTAGIHAIKAIRAPTVGAALRDTAAWMLVAALAFVAVFPQLAASRMLASHVFLPFYAIGSALLIDRLLERSPGFQRLAVAWLVAAPLWAFYILLTHPRSVLAPDDVAKTNAYLAANDHNDFVLSNLMSPGPFDAAFHRHEEAALDAEDASEAPRRMMRMFATTGADTIHAVIFKGRDSRFIDAALWRLAMPRRKWSITGFPHLHRAKTGALIAEYDRRVTRNLDAVRATKVLDLSNYTVYRIDRTALIAQLGEHLAATSRIDFTQNAATRHLLTGWEAARYIETAPGAVTTMEGTSAQLMIRVDRVCELQLTFSFVRDSYVRFAMASGVAATMLGGRTATFTVPAASLAAGINVIELHALLPRQVASVDLETVELVPMCPAP